jgi:hypothetical protein
MSVELFRITDADVLRAKDVWESQCGYGRVDWSSNGDVSLPQCIPVLRRQFELSNHRLGGLFLLLTMAQFGGSSNLDAAIPETSRGV